MIHHTHGAKAEYLIAQYIEDVFRREVRNMGVIVRKNGAYAAKFFGETEPGSVDGRRIKSLAKPEVYRQWIQYWRRVLATNKDPFAALLQLPSANYPCAYGGEILDTGDDSVSQVADFLYGALVAEGGFANAFNRDEDAEAAVVGDAVPRLSKEIEGELRSINILSEPGEELALVRHPVVHRPTVQGTTSEPHRPQFAQKNGRLYVMETVDFTDRVRERTRDHAGFVSFMFGDLEDGYKGGEVFPIAVVRVDKDVLLADETRYGLSMLNKTAKQVVNWADATERTRFLTERREIALSGN